MSLERCSARLAVGDFGHNHAGCAGREWRRPSAPMCGEARRPNTTCNPKTACFITEGSLFLWGFSGAKIHHSRLITLGRRDYTSPCQVLPSSIHGQPHKLNLPAPHNAYIWHPCASKIFQRNYSGIFSLFPSALKCLPTSQID